ncbi:MAG: InlB B-repeat-containing protein [Clostridiales bacterium]|nr:InlB B-repeat-containing protein [Clostridiales bacterium]
MKKKILIPILVLLLIVFLTGCATTSRLSNSLNSDIGNNESVGNLAGGQTNPSNSPFVVQFITNTTQVIPSKELITLTDDNVPSPNKEPPNKLIIKPGHRFEGWYLNQSLSGERIEFPYTLTQNVVLYAKWIENAIVRINTPEELYNIRNNLSGKYALAQNINLEGYSNWEPIGSREEPFTGTFDGNGRVITGMVIKDLVPDEEFNFLPYGLFGHSQGILQNVKLTNFTITLNGDLSRFYIGGIAGHISEGGELIQSEAIGVINNPKFDYVVKFADSFVGNREKPTTQTDFGLLVGRLESGKIEHCTSSGVINSVSHARDVYAGGLVGKVVSGIIRFSHSNADVIAQYAGGIIGYNDGMVERCYAEGTMKASTSYPGVAGGLVATNYPKGTIAESYSIGDVTARNAGGLVGINIFDYEVGTGGTIRDCYAAGNVYASEYGGGLAARVLGKIPINGYDGYHEIVRPPVNDDNHEEIAHRVVKNCLAYGNVEAVAERTTFLHAKTGEEMVAEGVFFSTFAGGLFGDAQEVAIEGCMAFGNVKALSKRAVGEGGAMAYNSVYANNVIGYSTRLTDITDSTKFRIYGSSRQVVTRNDMDYTSRQTSYALDPYEAGFGPRIRLELGLAPNLWIVDDVDIARGIYPRLHI